MSKTTTEKLEKRIEELEDNIAPVWIIVVCFVGIVLLSIVILGMHLNPYPQYATASPCELGLMEWEEETVWNSDAYFKCANDCFGYYSYITDNNITEDIRHLLLKCYDICYDNYTPKYINITKEPKSCKSGKEILVR